MFIVGMEGLYFDTQENELEMVGNERPTKTLWKDKNLRCTVDPMHLSSMGTSYIHHSMFYSRDRKNVTHFILGKDWKAVYKDYKSNSQILNFILKV
jgi:hypothetical protein